ncbi:putative late blight resistance protein homolog R1B-16 [Capsicum annuum]|uniref:putative late blight resistance protein homolog R1B-16 n=1 Tax=Capsicum annuum TaxID=4072 RepID=UPI001FB14A3B|nr:putative late blight resistance protein homolog R1B-16 [Capsicum annuum]
MAFFSWKDLDLLECHDRVYSTKGCLFQIVDKIKLVELEVMKIYEQMSCHANVNESESYLLESSAEKSSVVQDIVVGLDDDVLEIKTRFCSFSLKLEIVSLVGMGGIGKSTLARMVYDDPFIKYHFSIRAWVTVKDRQEKGLFLDLLDGILEFTDKIHEKHSEQLAEMLYRKLKHSRYLIVSYDVWSTEFLDLEESWELLCRKVGGRKFDRPDLEDIGKKIAEQCQGLPLTILVVAGQLSKLQRTRMCWQIFAKTVGSIVTDEHEKCLDILALRKQKTFENYAEECLEDLVNRNLAIVKQRRSNGRVKSCVVHDLLRDIGLREAQRENFFHFPELSDTADTLHCVRRLGNYRAASIEVPWKPLLPLSRTLLLSGYPRSLPRSQLHGPLLNKLLRVLDILHIAFDFFPPQVLQLVHLRYVALAVHEPECPESISRLWNLQTFILATRESLNLPKTVWEMENLRHVCLGKGCFLPNPTSGFNGCKVLTNLQTITYMDPTSCTREVTENIPHLKKLAIRGRGEWDSSQPSSYDLYSLFYLKQLEKLKRRYHNLLSMDFCPSNLKKLVLNSKSQERLPGFSQWPADTGTQSWSELEHETISSLVVGGVKYLDRDDSYAVVWLREPTEAVAKASPCRQLSLLMDPNLGDSIRDQDEGWEMN